MEEERDRAIAETEAAEARVRHIQWLLDSRGASEQCAVLWANHDRCVRHDRHDGPHLTARGFDWSAPVVRLADTTTAMDLGYHASDCNIRQALPCDCGWDRDSRPTAGDLLIAAVDKWAQHAMSCNLDTCNTCDVAINQLRLAYKVWQNSAHRKASR